MSNWDMCFYCKIKHCSLEDCPNRDRGRLQGRTARPAGQTQKEPGGKKPQTPPPSRQA